MHYHILLTENCNLRCRYCYEKSMKEFDNSLDKKFTFDYSDPEDSNINTEELKMFLEKDTFSNRNLNSKNQEKNLKDSPETNNTTLIFYGGEPLLKIDKIIEIINILPKEIKYRMQTNAILLDKLPIKYLKKIDKILISLDGNCKRTNLNRGQGIYEKVLNNIQNAREKGYTGEIVARMTIASDSPDIFNQVMHLIDLIDQNIINSIHWQLDVGFYSHDFDPKKSKEFLDEYNNQNKKLIDWWIEKIKEGKVYKIYPYIGIIYPLLAFKSQNLHLENQQKNAKDINESRETSIPNLGLRCGAGHSGYAITTSGKVVHCPIMNSIEDFKAGDLNTNPKDLKKFSCENECKNCEVYELCGGRCMYWRKAKLWPKEGDDMICNSIILYINYLKEKLPEIEEMIKKDILSINNFEYEDYFGPEIIP